AGHGAGRVVEDRAHLVAAAAGPGRRRAEDDRAAEGGSEQGACEQPSHGPGGTSAGLQSSVPLVSRHGAEPSGGGCVAEPGQRGPLRNVRPLRPVSSGGSAPSSGPAGVSVYWKVLKIGWMRA